MKTSLLKLVCGLALLCAAVPAPAQSVLYDNPQTSVIAPFGSVNSESTATYGTIFYAPAGGIATLNDFTVYFEGSETVAYQADVYAWNGSEATGPALFSQNSSMTGDGSLQAVTTTTGGVNLTSGSEYVAFFTTSDPGSIAANTVADGDWFFGLASGPLPNGEGGDMVYFNNQTSDQLTTQTWDETGGFIYSAFQADFNTSPVPEPTTLALAGLSGLGLLLFRRRK
jgi:hypothetical protein